MQLTKLFSSFFLVLLSTKNSLLTWIVVGSNAFLFDRSVRLLTVLFSSVTSVVDKKPLEIVHLVRAPITYFFCYCYEIPAENCFRFEFSKALLTKLLSHLFLVVN